MSPQNSIGRVVYEPAASTAGQTLLVAPGLVVVLERPVAHEVVSRVWTEVSSDSRSLERVVQSIPFLGRDGVASFAVAAIERGDTDDPIISVVARGESVVDVYVRDAPHRRFSSQGLQPWHLSSFSGVTGLRFSGTQRAPASPAALTLSATGFPARLAVVSAASTLWILDDDAVESLVSPSDGVEIEDDAEITLERAPERRRARHGGPAEASRPRDPTPSARHRPCRVRIGSGAPFELHVPVYVGRRPRGPRQLSGDQVILIEVPSPTREVSASHLHIVQRGPEVVVTDLRSTNGTAVTLPGAPRIKLHQGDSIVLPPYSRIEIGDGNVIEILPGAN